MNMFEKFSEACKAGNLIEVKRLLKLNNAIKNKTFFSPDHFNPAGYFNHPLRIAAKNGHLEVLKYLVEELKDKNDKPICNPADCYDTAIWWAAEQGHLKVVKYLVELKDSKGNLICTPEEGIYRDFMPEIAKNGHKKVVCYLYDVINAPSLLKDKNILKILKERGINIKLASDLYFGFDKKGLNWRTNKNISSKILRLTGGDTAFNEFKVNKKTPSDIDKAHHIYKEIFKIRKKNKKKLSNKNF